MYYAQGQQEALSTLGLIKEAGWVDKLLSRLARGRGRMGRGTELTGSTGSKVFRTLFGEPQRLLHPVQLVKEVASLKPTREAWQMLRHGQGFGQRARGFGRLAMDVGDKAFLLGMPAYGTYEALTNKLEPGETRGQHIGRSVGEALGWLPPMGILGTAASFLTPKYSLPALTGWLGGKLGGGVSEIMGEQPAPTSLLARSSPYNPETSPSYQLHRAWKSGTSDLY